MLLPIPKRSANSLLYNIFYSNLIFVINKHYFNNYNYINNTIYTCQNNFVMLELK